MHDAEPVAGAYAPAAQAVHVAAPGNEYAPELQTAQTLAPTPEYEPAAQAEDANPERPDVAHENPAGHNAHIAAPTSDW